MPIDGQAEVAHPVTDDAFLGGRLMLLQPAAGYRAGLDAVVLAATVQGTLHTGARVLDLGAGVGTVGLCVAARHPGVTVTLFEREPVLARLAARNIERNGFAGRVQLIEGDLEASAAELERAGLAPDSFDCVMANPPFHIEGRGKSPPDALRAAAHVMAAGGIERWTRVMARVTRPGGGVAMIHRADALLEILTAFDGRFGAIGVTPVCPRPASPAVRVFVSGVKGSKAPLQLHAPLSQSAMIEAALPSIRQSSP